MRCRRGQFSALGDLMGDFQSATLIHVESKVVHGRVLVELKPDRRYSSRKKKSCCVSRRCSKQNRWIQVLKSLLCCLIPKRRKRILHTVVLLIRTANRWTWMEVCKCWACILWLEIWSPRGFVSSKYKLWLPSSSKHVNSFIAPVKSVTHACMFD